MNVKLGKYNQLEVVKEVDFGVYLDGGDDGYGSLPCPTSDSPVLFLRISPITVRESFGRVGSYPLPLLPRIAGFGYAKAGAGIY